MAAHGRDESRRGGQGRRVLTIVGISGLPMLRPGLPVWRPANGLNIISVLGPCSPLATAAARNQQALRSYSWISKTELSLKGEVKNTKIESCKYGPDGKVMKTELTEPPEPPEGGRKRRGGALKGKVVAKKKAEMQKELEETAALIHGYVPPAAEKIQAAIAAGKVTISPGAATAVRFADYLKAGDAFTLTLDSESKSIRQVAVDTWLDDPEKKVTLRVDFQLLPDGTNYAASTVLAIPKDNLEVRIENSNYNKVAP